MNIRDRTESITTKGVNFSKISRQSSQVNKIKPFLKIENYQ